MVYWLWWFKTAWIHGLPAENNTLIAAPFGADWAGVVEKGSIWPGVMLARLANEIAAYNLLVLSSFLLAAIAAYRLVLFLTGNRTASVVAGLVYAYAPYHLWKAWAWIPLSNTQWIAFYCLALLKWRREARLREALLAGFWFALTLLSSYIYGLAAIVLTLVHTYTLGLRRFVAEGRLGLTRTTLIQCFASMAVAAALVMPVVGPILRTQWHAAPGWEPSKYRWPVEDLQGLTARVSDYLVPPASSRMYRFFSPLDDPDTPRGDFTHGLFLGYTTLALVSVALASWQRRRERGSPGHDRYPTLLFGVVLTVSLALSLLPPITQISLPGLGPVQIRGPAWFGYQVAPWFREYSRFGVLALLASSVLAGFGVLEILQSRRRKLLFLLCTLGLVIEFAYRPPPGFPIRIPDPPAVYRWLRSRPGPLTIAEYPVARESQVSPAYLYWATFHGKRLVHGHGFSRAADLLIPAVLDLGEPQAAPVLRYLGTDLVLVHHSFPGFERWYGSLPASAVSGVDFGVVSHIGTATVLKPLAPAATAVVVPADGFSLGSDSEGKPAWWTASGGILRLLNLTDESVEVRIQFDALSRGREVELVATGQTGDLLPISGSEKPGGKTVVIGPLTVRPSHLTAGSAPVLTATRLSLRGGDAEVGIRRLQLLGSENQPGR